MEWNGTVTTLFYVGAGGAVVSPVFGFAPPVWHDATKNVTMNKILLPCVDRNLLDVS